MSGYDPGDPRSHREYRRIYALSERQRCAAGLVAELADLSAEVDKAAAALDRRGGRAIRRRLVNAMRGVIDWHRLTGLHQAELDELTGVSRPPTQIIDFPKARITALRVVGKPDPGIATAIRACGESPIRGVVDSDGGDHAA